ncbi:hydrogenase maturation nickel metallochaperone HypA [Candidatus Nitrospira salsa]|nr:MAG: putative hydrogenase nickel incorporation protein HypA [Nitrospirales bacterium]
MHELSLTRNIVSIVSEKAQGAKVTQVTLEIGKFSAVLPDALQFCFDIVTKGTVAEGAELEIIETPGTGVCATCGTKFSLQQMFDPCPCGSTDIIRRTGSELNIKQMVTA